MPIDVSVKDSAGWWMNRLFNMLAEPKRQNRFDRLANYKMGKAPLPLGAENAREIFETFQRKARSNFGDLIVSAMSERMAPGGFRSALDNDETGDAEVADLWERAGLDVESANVHDTMLTLSEAYVIVGGMDEETGAPFITGEDPRYIVGEPDPQKPTRLRAALKLLHDDAEGEDRAYVYLPGQVWVARRKASASDVARPSQTGPTLVFGSPQQWDWDTERSGSLPHNRIPVVRFLNKDALGEYETHTDLIDRINHQILQRMVIATMQAFRQRAISGLPLYDESSGEEIDYSEVFTMDPAAIWQLPETAKMWESQQVDLRPILEAVKDDVEHLAAVTRTPMFMLSPAGVNQSAEGASLSREGLVFKVRDRIARLGPAWAQVMSLALLMAGDSSRADLGRLRTIWASPEHLSLAERGDAASKLQGVLPRRTLLITILGMTPPEADRAMTELADEQLQQAMVQAAALAANPPQQQTGGQPGQQQTSQQQRTPVTAGQQTGGAQNT